LKEKAAAPVQKSENMAIGIRHTGHVGTLNPQKLALASPTSGGRSVGIVRSWTQTIEFLFKYSRELIKTIQKTKQKQTLWPYFANELYRPSDRRLSAKLVQTFEDTGCYGYQNKNIKC
jgi:hypothetical protein